ncbi:MAG: hypothetical protein WA840_04965 [Caulobacteraceae bacterium]
MTGIRSKTLLAAFLLAAPAMAHAQRGVDPGRAAVVQAISDCRKQTDDAARLACYDKAANNFEQAQNKGDVVVVDREQVRQVNRQSFGFNLPSISIFSHGTKEAPPENISVEIGSAQQQADGKWLLTTSEDAVWRQIDTAQLVDTPRRGDKLVVRRAMLGSFFCKVGKEPSIRCVRER